MKIDAAKQSSNYIAAKTKTNATGNNLNNLNDGTSTEEFGGLESDFASIFESVVNRDKDKDFKTKDKPTEKESASHSSGEHDKITEKEEKDDTDTGSGNAETNAGMSAWRMSNNEGNVVNLENVHVRAIVHIADLEKIVSSVRTQLMENGAPQVVIDLKRSVLDGLQIKLTTDQNNKVIAEFIASSEKVKAQIETKTKELFELLQGRGIQVGSIKTSLNSSAGNGSWKERNNEQNEQSKNQGKVSLNEVRGNTEQNNQVVNENVYRA